MRLGATAALLRTPDFRIERVKSRSHQRSHPADALVVRLHDAPPFFLAVAEKLIDRVR